MKRQHPDNPDLFWCSKCKTYKARGEFYNNKSNTHGINYYCRECASERNKDRVINKEKYRESDKRWRESHRKECAERSALWRSANKDYFRQYWKKRRAENPIAFAENHKRNDGRARRDLFDSYIKILLNSAGVPVTPETIELKRQQIIMKRTLKQFKEWRKEYESNNADVQRE